MADATPLPTLSQVRGMKTNLLESADYWERTAKLSDDVFTNIHERMSTPGDVPWTGQAATVEEERALTDMLKVRPWSLQLYGAAPVARLGDAALHAIQEEVLLAVGDAQRDGFEVGEDYSVRDPRPASTREQLLQRQEEAKAHRNFIRHRVAHLVAKDHEINTQLSEILAGVGNLTFVEAPATDSPSTDGHNGVQVVGYGHHLEAPSPGDPAPPPSPRVPGLPPEGITPPVSGKLTPGPASRPSQRALGGQSLWDEKGGEWRYFPGDKYHHPHWDYNPHDTKFSEWQNLPIGDRPPLKEQPPAAEPPAPARPPAGGEPLPPARPEPAPPPAAPPVKSAPVEPPAPRPAPPRIGIGGGGTWLPGLGHSPAHEPVE